MFTPGTDTIDLQDHNGPSTQNQAHPRFDPDDSHHRAPHQAETLREVAHETAEELLRTPTVPPVAGSAPSITHKPADSDHDAHRSHGPDAQAADLDHDAFTMDAYRQHEQDAIAAAHNGVSSSDEEDIDGEIDDLDDDLMDKISSSPSIEDGVYPPTAPAPTSTRTGKANAYACDHDWPRRVSSLPTTSRFRRQAAARFFSSQWQSPLSQQPRPLLLPRSAPGKYASAAQPDSESTIDNKLDALQDIEPDKVSKIFDAAKHVSNTDKDVSDATKDVSDTSRDPRAAQPDQIFALSKKDPTPSPHTQLDLALD